MVTFVKLYYKHYKIIKVKDGLLLHSSKTKYVLRIVFVQNLNDFVPLYH